MNDVCYLPLQFFFSVQLQNMKDKRSISMAANKWTKWMVGLSSVAAFTTFIGLSQKYDQTNSTAPALNNDASADNSSQTQTEDETEIFPDSGSGSNTNNGTNGQDQWSNDSSSEQSDQWSDDDSSSQQDQWSNDDAGNSQDNWGNNDDSSMQSRPS
ncbi:hypothetical protein R7236_06150 [Priestia megaterium]|uniref:hypothetical protein n=2 Tax=Priestia megaterium TaxID=1404 RepID=UPI00296FE33F|nr:hypothetical protein [Priestia megaterium]MDW4507975.1 hypothetical protein [Priestia megaterium]